MIKVKVVFFASLRERLGVSEGSVELETTTSISSVLDKLVEQYGSVGESVLKQEQVLVALNQEMCDLDQLVSEGDEVAFFPPVTGG